VIDRLHPVPAAEHQDPIERRYLPENNAKKCLRRLFCMMKANYSGYCRIVWPQAPMVTQIDN